MRLSLRSWLILIAVLAVACVPFRRVAHVLLGTEINEEQEVLADLGPQWSVESHRTSRDKPMEIILGRDYNRIWALNVGSGTFDDTAVASVKGLYYLRRLTFNDTIVSAAQLDSLQREMPRLDLRYRSFSSLERSDRLQAVVDVIERVEIADATFDDKQLNDLVDALVRSGGAKKLRKLELTDAIVTKPAAISAQRRLHLDEIQVGKTGQIGWRVPEYYGH